MAKIYGNVSEKPGQSMQKDLTDGVEMEEERTDPAIL